MVLDRCKFAAFVCLSLGLSLALGCKPTTIDPKTQLAPPLATTLGIPNNYMMSPYPVDNFGIFTAYKPPSGQSWSELNQICATWDCLGVDAKDIPKDADARLNIDGFASVGNGGTLTFDTTTQDSFGVKLLLPALAKLIDINGNVDWSRNVTVKVQLGNAHMRTLNRIKADNYLNHTLHTGNPLKDAFDQGQLVMIVADYVVDSLDATITVNKDLNAGANAALSQSASVNLPVGKDAKGNPASLSASLENKGNGDYHLSVKNPVVIAVLAKQQPGAGVLGPAPSGADPWTDWTPVGVPLKWRFQ
jgi:hypothetical protein